jgi:hypothetical protein
VLDEVIVNQQRDDLPEEVLAFIRKLLVANTRANVGFRRRNLPALLLRFFRDMRAVLQNCRVYLRGSATAMIVVGDSYTMVADERLLIPTTDFVEAIGRHVGFHSSARLEISVTTENRCHMKNAITRNVALHMKAG